MKTTVLFILLGGILFSNIWSNSSSAVEETSDIIDELTSEEGKDIGKGESPIDNEDTSKKRNKDSKKNEEKTETGEVDKEKKDNSETNKEETDTDEADDEKTKPSTDEDLKVNEEETDTGEADKEREEYSKTNEEETEKVQADDEEKIPCEENSDCYTDIDPSFDVDDDIFPETNFTNFIKSDLNKINTIQKGKIGKDHPTSPGEIMVFKEAQAVEGRVNTWEVTLRIEAMNKPRKNDIVLVIDKSGSMKNPPTRLIEAKRAAKKFAELLVDEGHFRIALVSYATYPETDQALTSSYDDLVKAIDRLVAGGGTFTQAAIRQAAAILKNSDADNKYIVLLSDGEPNYSYAMKYPIKRATNYVTAVEASYGEGAKTKKVNGYETTKNIPQDEFKYDVRVGEAAVMRYLFCHPNLYMYNHGNSAVAESIYAGRAGYDIFTIGLQTQGEGSSILNQIKKGTGTFTEVKDPEQLTPILEQIASDIGAAVRDGKVVDTMGEGFEISEENIEKIWTSQGEVKYEGDKLTWLLDSLKDPIAEGSQVNYAELKYIVEINDDIFEVESEDGLYPSNKEAHFNCLGIDDCAKHEVFPIPMVKPLIGKITKEVQNKDGKVIQKDEDFEINISGPDNFEKSYFINTSDGNKSLNFTDLRMTGEYTLEEVGDLSGYDITYLVNGKEGNKFLVREDNGEDIDLKIINKEKCGKIVINKELEENNLPEIPSFEFKVTGPNGFEEVFTLPENDKWVKEIYDLELGKYTVTELTDSYKTSVKVEDGEFENKKSVEVNINNTCLEKNIHFKNEFEKFDFQIQKRSSKYDVNLENAGFTLYSTNGSWEQGKELDVKMTDSNGLAKFEKLLPGRYILKETKVPDGYMSEVKYWKLEVETAGTISLSTDKDKEVVSEDIDGVTSYIIYNLAGINLPSTGNGGEGLYIVLGSSLTVIALITLYVKRKSHGKSK